ncbi:MAG: asparagine--tRNA ligase [Chlamydiota bacterium]
MRTKIKQLLHSAKSTYLEQKVYVCGWIKTARAQKNFTFLEINDGSCFANLQIICDSALPFYDKMIVDFTTGASIAVEGIVKESPGQKQSIEIHASAIRVLGTCDSATYPLQKKQHSPEFLRSIAHLRPRTNTQGAVIRVRNTLAFATHEFFQSQGFVYVQTPIITGSDCEGGGAMFQVTTLDMDNPPRLPNGKVDATKDFFAKKTYLTVSGQLNGETLACALSDIYTFGPTFRAENSNTARHLAEFWMIEPEMAFADLKDNMSLAERYIKFLVETTLNRCTEDLKFFDKYIEPGLLERLTKIAHNASFEHVTYTEAISILKKASKAFTFPVEWGVDLQSEHERYLTEDHFKKPVIVTDYPAQIKAFYMRGNEDGKTVAAMDVLVPKIGELIGGSQREERLSVLEGKIESLGFKKEDYSWYLELRKYGSVPHAGFGAGFERLVQFITGIENIRDVNSFPRFPGHAEF